MGQATKFLSERRKAQLAADELAWKSRH